MIPYPIIPDNSQNATDENGKFVTTWFTFFSGLSKAIQLMPQVLTIAASSDFPIPKNAQVGLMQCLVTASVTDNDPSRTNTGLSFSADDYIVWNGSTWIILN
jgi:hypothetical protein